MKKRITLFILLLLSCFISFAQDWEQVSSIGTEWMTKVYAQGTENVYVIGEKGFIAKSTDKALTWTKQHLTPEVNLNDIVFCNEEVGFIVGDNGTILKTDDSGAHWRQITVETAQHINAIATNVGNSIWVVGNGGLVMHSSDLGETWTADNLVSDNRDLFDVKLRENIGYIAGQGGNVFKTETGGLVWEEQMVFENFTENHISNLNLTENKTFACIGSDDHSAIGFTSDNQSWSILDAEELWSLRSFHFNDDNNGFSASYAWTVGSAWVMWLHKTIDAGNTWEECVLPRPLYGDISQKSNFSFLENNEFGYLLCGQVLLRTPYNGDFYVGLNEIKSEIPRIFLKQSENELQVSSSSKTISNVEIISITGIKVQQEDNLDKEFSMDTSQLPKGIYLVRVAFADNTSNTVTVKWIKK